MLETNSSQISTRSGIGRDVLRALEFGMTASGTKTVGSSRISGSTNFFASSFAVA